MSKKMVLTGGGSAGHVIPALALIPGLKQAGFEVHFIGGSGIEKVLVQENFREISCEKLRRSFSPKNLFLPLKVYKGYRQSLKLLKELRPALVFSKGGFTAVPVCFAAAKLKIPIVSHESDLTLGLANRLIYRKCKVMFCSFQETVLYGNKMRHSGSIIRSEILNLSLRAERSNLKTVLILGGSLGAAALNNIVFDALPELTKKYNIIHICGRGKTRKTEANNYTALEYTSEIEKLYAKADYVVSRAGSGTIFELLYLKKPMLLIPLPKKSSRGDQLLNAQVFEKQGFAKVLQQENLTIASLLRELSALEDFKFPKTVPNIPGNEIVLSYLLNLF